MTDRQQLQNLQQRLLRMQGTSVARSLPVLPVFDGLVRLRTGEAYAVDSPGLAMALLAGPSLAGEWCAIIGAPDFGFEAAAAFGLDLDRTIAVPDPGEHWLSVAAGLVDITTVVVLKAPPGVTDQQAGRLKARLRQKDALLLIWGEWPRCAQRLTVESSSWRGIGTGHGRLTGRQIEVAVTTAGAPPQSLTMWLPDENQQIRLAEPDFPVTGVGTARRAG